MLCSLSRQSCNWMGLPAPIQIKHQYRTENAHACAKHDHCERTILSTVSILAKESDQWSVSLWQCWKLTKLEFVRHLRPCAGRLFCCWCCATGSQESYCYQLPWITLPVRVPSKKEHEWAEHWTTFAMLKEQTLVLGSSSLSRQSWQLNGPSCTNSHQTPVPNRERTCMCQAWPLRENHSLHSVHSRKRVRSMKSISLAMLKVDKAWVCQTPQTLCRKIVLLLMLCDRLPGILLLPATMNHVACSSSQQERAEHPTTWAMPEEQALALVQCLSSLAN